MHRRPPRLKAFDYRGLHRYFLTGCTRHRAPAFLDPAFAAHATSLLLHCAERSRFEVTAYCLMPDHAHVLLSAQDDAAALRECWFAWRQRTGFTWRLAAGQRPWQDGSWDYVLREHDDSRAFAAYLVHNPVRAGLVATPSDYPWLGSGPYSIQELVDAVQIGPPRRPRE